MKVGVVAILGRPNSGKSTLLNKLLNYPLAITTPVSQTTRDQIRGIYQDDDSQIVFLDTPGLSQSEEIFKQTLNKKALQNHQDADLILWLHPIDQKLEEEDYYWLLKFNPKNVMMIITKIDLDSEHQKSNQLKKEVQNYHFLKIVEISKYDDSYKNLIEIIKNNLPSGQPLYPLDTLTNVSMRFIAKEIIRESVIKHTYHEIPFSLAVVIDIFKELEDLNHIEATLFVERDSQKGIIIGQKGQMIKKIGIYAREQITNQFKIPTVLKLYVKVKKNWTRDRTKMKDLGY